MSVHATLIRHEHSDECVLGTLAVGGQVFATLERPWRDNRRNTSCIPTGRYAADYLPSSASGRYREVWHVQPVPGRSGILIHHGNVVDHTRGCILLGLQHGRLGGKRAVLSSRRAMRTLRELVGRQSFDVEVVGHA